MQPAQILSLRIGGLVLAVVLTLAAIGMLLERGGRAKSPAASTTASPAAGTTPSLAATSGSAASRTPLPPAAQPAATKAPATAVATAAPVAAPAPSTAPANPTASTQGKPKPPAPARERVEADVSTRSVAVTSAFTGVEIVVFGSVINTQSETAESGLYDVVVVVEGSPSPLIARKKSNVAGLWINTSSLRLDHVPSYYAIASTRPLIEVAENDTLAKHGIGFDHLQVPRGPGADSSLTDAELADFKKSVVRLKKKEGVYFARDYAVAFIGQSLFRATIALPANVPVGPLAARVHLFKDGEHLSNYTAQVKLEREGVGRWLHSFAFDHGTLYGIFTVIIAVAAGLAASTMFRRGGAH
jgi:uncharacterized protein (TIGR02186 family)